MKKALFLLLVLPLVAQSKIVTKVYPKQSSWAEYIPVPHVALPLMYLENKSKSKIKPWRITYESNHGRIVPNSHIAIDLGSERIEGTYTNDGLVECEALTDIYKNKYRIIYKVHNEEGRLNPKNKNKPQVSVVGISLAEKVYFGGKKYTVTENDTTYFLTSKNSLDFAPTTNDFTYPERGMAFSQYPIIGATQSISLEIPKSRLIDMFSLEKREFAFSGQFHAVIIYENGRADVILSEGKGDYGTTTTIIEQGTLNLNTGETIVIDKPRNEYYATTTKRIKLLPGWHKKYKETKQNEGESLTHYYHRAYITEKEKNNSDTKNTDNRESELIAQVEALGETPYQKAVKALLIKYQKRFEWECFVSSKSILGGSLISVIATGSSKIINMATFTAEIAPCLMEAMMNRPATCKSIMADMEKDMKQSKILNLRKPIEHELEELQLKRVNEKLSK